MNDNMVKEVSLTNGAAVRCRPVPPHALGPVILSFKEPEFPYVEVKGAAGVERHPALQGTPEYDAWVLERNAHDLRVSRAVMDFDLEYGIISWKLPGVDEYTNQVPKDFSVPGIMKRYGVETSDDPYERRLQFIKYALITTSTDDDTVSAVTKAAKPVTAKEVETTLAPFESDEQSPEA